MIIKLKNELLYLNILVILLFLIIIFLPSSVVRMIVGLPFILFFPGYTLTAALFPKRQAISGIERVSLSFGLSIVIVPLIGLSLNFTRWGILLYPMLISTSIFIIIMSVITLYRRHKLAEEERFTISFYLKLAPWKGRPKLDIVLYVALGVTLLVAIGIVSQSLTGPKAGENLTEFYILNADHEAADYPKQLVVGEEGKLIMSITNSENRMMVYRVEVNIDGTVHDEYNGIILENGETWEQEVSVIPKFAGNEQRVEFSIFKDVETEPYLSPLHLWIDVRNE